MNLHAVKINKKAWGFLGEKSIRPKKDSIKLFKYDDLSIDVCSGIRDEFLGRDIVETWKAFQQYKCQTRSVTLSYDLT